MDDMGPPRLLKNQEQPHRVSPSYGLLHTSGGSGLVLLCIQLKILHPGRQSGWILPNATHQYVFSPSAAKSNPLLITWGFVGGISDLQPHFEASHDPAIKLDLSPDPLPTLNTGTCKHILQGPWYKAAQPKEFRYFPHHAR